MNFDNPDIMQAYIEKKVEAVMRNQLSKVAVDIVKDQLDRDLYSRPDSDWYVRTGELKNSVIATYDDNFASRSRKGQKRIIIDHNTTRNFMPSGHRSIVNNRIQNANIPFWVDGGYQGILSTPFLATDYFNKSFNRIVEVAVPVMVIGLKAVGIDAYEI